MKPRTKTKNIDNPTKAPRTSVLTRELKARSEHAFGREVRRRRKAQRMTLEELARRSDLAANYIGSIELGRRDPSLSTVLSLAAGLGVAPHELFGGKLSPAALEVALSFERCEDEAARASILKMLRAVDRTRTASKPTK